MDIKYCSSKKHDKNEAIIYCQACKVYMCNKCSNHHSELFEEHIIKNLIKDSKEPFTGICNEENHKNELVYLCKTHNILCCAACLSKINSNGNGQHKDCDVCCLEDIKEEKKNKLKENIKYLEEVSKTIEKSINEIKIIIEKINKSKEELKLEVQRIFSKIKKEISEREDEILAKVDVMYNVVYFNDENIIKNFEKLPKIMEASLKKGKIIENEWNEEKNKLNSLINDCVNIENNINDIKSLNDIITNYNSIKANIKFIPEEKNINSLIDIIKNFGNIILIEDIHPDIYNYIIIIKSKLGEYKNKIIVPKLIYDAKRDGQNYSNCHAKCNNVPNTFSLITTNKDKKFALFRSIPINGSGPWSSDNKAFFISLDKEKIYRMKKDTKAIAFDDTTFIQTLNFTMKGNNILSSGYSSQGKDSMNQYFEGFTEDYELTGGESSFTVKAFEVFQLQI